MWFQKPPLGTPLNWEHPLNKDLALHLAMNEGHGNRVQDLSMNGNHGILHNFAYPPTVASGWNPGYKGVVPNFDGGNDYIDCGNNASVTDEITVSALVKRSGNSGASDGIIDKNANFNGWLLRLSDNRIKLFMREPTAGPPNYKLIQANSMLPDETFAVAMAVRDSNYDMWLYIDGVKQTNTENFPYSWDTSGGTLEIGRYVAGYFTGTIDQPRILSRAYSAKEAKDYAMNPWQVYLDEDD